MNHLTLKNDSSHEWRDIAGYEGLYQVSSLGSVRNIRSGVLLTPCVSPNGYCNIALCKKELKVKTARIHRLVALTFLGNPPDENYVVNHKNGVKTDNRLSNIEWVTRSQNSIHAIKNGLQDQQNKEKIAKFSKSIKETWKRKKAFRLKRETKVDVRLVRELLNLTQKDLAKYLNVKPNSISSMEHGVVDTFNHDSKIMELLKSSGKTLEYLKSTKRQ